MTSITPPGFTELSKPAYAIVESVIMQARSGTISRADVLDISASLLMSAAAIGTREQQLMIVALFNQKLEEAIEALATGKPRSVQ